KPPQSQKEAEELLQRGRKLLAEGQFDEVSSIVQAVQSFKGHYGLFADAPEKLANALVKARSAHDKAESARLLKEARKLCEAGELDKAQNLAYRAQRMHGTYYIWELGDRP